MRIVCARANSDVAQLPHISTPSLLVYRVCMRVRVYVCVWQKNVYCVCAQIQTWHNCRTYLLHPFESAVCVYVYLLCVQMAVYSVCARIQTWHDCHTYLLKLF